MIKSQSFFAYSRSGYIDINGKEIEFPSVLDSNTVQIKEDQISLMGENATKRDINIGKRNITIAETNDFIVPLINPFFLKRSRQTVNLILDIKKNVGYDKLLYIPGISDPYLIPQLFMLGIDLFDDVNADIEGSHGTLYTMMGRIYNGEDDSKANGKFLQELVSLLKKGVESMTLMEMVERWNISSKAREIIRMLMDEKSGEFEKVYPRTTGSVIAGGLESLERPDIARFNRYVLEDYIKPNNLETILFLPCSARKPYSQSKSHREIFEALGSLRRHINEVIVTSPITLVPRELEETYPAGFYDIPVTGNWFMEEKENIIRSIKSFVSKNQYKNTIFFLPEDMLFVKERLNLNEDFILWRKGNDNQFDELKERISRIHAEEDSRGRRDFMREKLLSIARYQFGEWILPHIDGLKINRMFNQFMLVDGNKPFFVFNERLGKFTIHKNAAELFIKARKFLVEIDDFKPTASIYAMGVKDCTEDVRQEDEVVIHHSGTVRGTGIAKMSKEVMMNTHKGVAVKVRN
ncbi:DUF5591 domain-containing protein [Cuniculiplasma divulgatum]|uniref:Archaeosine tRNA-ribosyltransferase n=1 Tax=Cuniculiplasma divulgatum TaxID=1673428 RepID=A0A1R4A6L4_9ARCH|nr:DUF5591 domain-containing protein [Cuniculiplasma divulgatum]SJK84590.1 archaeosine tRNA-ribosyltransferase [Cuniculiplasma divulgatum]